MRPTEKTYQLSDQFYCQATGCHLGLAPTRERLLPHRCGVYRVGVSAYVRTVVMGSVASTTARSRNCVMTASRCFHITSFEMV